MANDLYLVLQVSREAISDEIHSTYARRALELHPDGSGAGSEPFIELQRAYSVLSDPERRSAYDHRTRSIPIRRAAARGLERPAPFRAVEPVSGFSEVSLSQSFETFGPSFDELFDRLWSNFDQITRPKPERLESLTVEISLSSHEAFAGGTARIFVPTRLVCQTCHGHGEIGQYECWRCQGQGAVTTEYPLDVAYPAGLRRDYVARLPLESFGIQNFYLTVRFRPRDF